MIRSLRIADAAALLLFVGKSPVNEARVRDRLCQRGRVALMLSLLKDCMVPGNSRRNYIYTHHGLIRGMVCLKSCRGPSTWEVDSLLFTPGNEEHCLRLLEKLDFTEAGRLFLRLDSDSEAIEMATNAGFRPYLTEFLYCLDGKGPSEPGDQKLTLSSRTSLSDYKVFRLYNKVVPLAVRSIEGMTFQEWHQSRDIAVTRERVFEREEEVSAWVRFRFDGIAGQFDFLTSGGIEEVEKLVNYSLDVLKGRHPVYCLVPEFQQQLIKVIEERGFLPVAEYRCLSKQLLVRVQEPQLVPLRA